MRVGTHYNGTINRKKKLNVFTWGWNPERHVIWHVVPISPRKGGPQLDWNVEVERANNSQVTYWVKIENLTNYDVRFEMRYVLLN